MCPVVELCAARGELASHPAAVPQNKREIHYALDCREGKVFLVQRAQDVSLMPGMWELPEVEIAVAGADKQQVPRFARNDKKSGQTYDNPKRLLFTLRHSITITDYTVKVQRMSALGGVSGKWVVVERLARLPLTGLARKILRKAELL
jgi:A/G-specific adenine glycosylase